MAISFTNDRWDRIKEDAAAWWDGDLKRPLIVASSPGDPGRDEPTLRKRHFISFYDLSIPASDVVDRIDYDLSCRDYVGDGFPYVFTNFGPGVIASFVGADLVNTEETNTVWFHYGEDRTPADLSFVYPAEESVWCKRVKEFCKAADERWNGSVQVSMPDLGGNLDIISSFRPSEKLLFDLYDFPEEIKRLIWEAHDLWWKYYGELDEILATNPGRSAWAGIFSKETHYMLQCDFCYMIGPDMFDEFVKPELRECCRKLDHSFYHLDGPGQLAHLDSLLEIEELDGVQWIPGDGQPDMKHWAEVYRKIRDAGKKIQLFQGLDTLDTVAEQLGSAEGIVHICEDDVTEQEVRDMLQKWS